MLLVTSGIFKGRTLVGADSIRSTKSIVRTAIFNIIYSHYPDFLEGCTVLDLYGGTGMLSFEALSRGASRAIINEINPMHRNIAMNNALKLSLAGKVTFTSQDAVKYKGNLDDISIIFADPPFYKKLGKPTIENIIRNKSADKKILVVMELCKEDMRDFMDGNSYEEPRKYGRSYIQIFTI